MGRVEGLGLKMPEQHEEAGDKPSGTKTCSSQQCKRKNCTGLGQGLPGALCPKQVSISFASGKWCLTTLSLGWNKSISIRNILLSFQGNTTYPCDCKHYCSQFSRTCLEGVSEFFQEKKKNANPLSCCCTPTHWSFCYPHSCAIQGASSSRSFHLTLNIKVSAFTQQVVPEP